MERDTEFRKSGIHGNIHIPLQPELFPVADRTACKQKNKACKNRERQGQKYREIPFHHDRIAELSADIFWKMTPVNSRI